MKLEETFYDRNGNAIGRIAVDSQSGHVAFRPAEGIAGPPCGLYRHVDDLKRDLTTLYGDVRGPHAHGTG